MAVRHESRHPGVYYQDMAADHLSSDTSLPHTEHPHRDWPFRRTIIIRYGVAVLAVLAALAMRYVIYGDLSSRMIFTFFVPAAMVAVWYGGLGPGLLATVLGLFVADFFFLPPRFAFWPIDGAALAALGIYMLTTTLCVVLFENLHRLVRRHEHTLERARAHFHAEAHGLATAEPEDGARGGLPREWPYRRPVAARYGLAVGLVIVAFALRYWVFDIGESRFAFLFFVPAAIVAAWYGGLAPGLVATATGLMLGDYFFLAEHEALGPVRETERVAMGLYAVITTLCVMLFENLHNHIRRLEHALERARHHHYKLHPGPHAAAPDPLTVH